MTMSTQESMDPVPTPKPSLIQRGIQGLKNIKENAITKYHTYKENAEAKRDAKIENNNASNELDKIEKLKKLEKPPKLSFETDTYSLNIEDYDKPNTTFYTGDDYLAKLNTEPSAVPVKVLFSGQYYIGVCKFNSDTLEPSEIVPIAIQMRKFDNDDLSKRETKMNILKNVELFKIDSICNLHSNNSELRNQKLFELVTKKYGPDIIDIITRAPKKLTELRDESKKLDSELDDANNRRDENMISNIYTQQRNISKLLSDIIPYILKGKNFFEPVSRYNLVDNSNDVGKSRNTLLRDRVFLCTSTNNEPNILMICVVTIVCNRYGGTYYSNNDVLFDCYNMKVNENSNITFKYYSGGFIRTGEKIKDGNFVGATGTTVDIDLLQLLNTLTFYQLPELPVSSGGKKQYKRSIKKVKKRKGSRKGISNKKRKGSRKGISTSNKKTKKTIKHK